MKVSRSGYYNWLNRPISNRAKESQEFTKAIKEVFIQNRNIYGTRRITKILAKNDILISIWSMANHMKAKLVNDALTMALFQRKPKRGLIWHSDRGSQYASISHREILKDHGIIQSMSRKGDCF